MVRVSGYKTSQGSKALAHRNLQYGSIGLIDGRRASTVASAPRAIVLNLQIIVVQEQIVVIVII